MEQKTVITFLIPAFYGLIDKNFQLTVIISLLKVITLFGSLLVP